LFDHSVRSADIASSDVVAAAVRAVLVGVPTLLASRHPTLIRSP
jgi:hypothetical protein